MGVQINSVDISCDVRRCRQKYVTFRAISDAAAKGWRFIGIGKKVALCPTHTLQREEGKELDFLAEARKHFSTVDVGALDGGDEE